MPDNSGTETKLSSVVIHPKNFNVTKIFGSGIKFVAIIVVLLF